MNANSVPAASATSRCMAFAVDIVVGAALMWVAMYAILKTGSPRTFLLATGYGHLAFVLAVPALVFSTFLAHGNATPGMIAADIQVLDKRAGTAIGWTTAILRTLLWPLSVAPAGAGLLTYFITKRRQTLHDIVTGSIVVERPFIGVKLAYRPWPVFWTMTLRAGPVIMAVTLAALVYLTSADRARDFLVDAAAVSAALTVLLTASISILKVHTSKARLTPRGIQRSGLLGWKKTIIPWDEIDHATVKIRRYFSYLRCKTINKSSFRLPLDTGNTSMAAQELGAHGVRIE